MKAIKPLFAALFVSLIFTSCGTIERVLQIKPANNAIQVDTMVYIEPISDAKRLLFDPSLPEDLKDMAKTGVDLAAWGFGRSWTFHCDLEGQIVFKSKPNVAPLISDFSQSEFALTSDGFKILINEDIVIQFKASKGRYYKVRALSGNTILEGSGTSLWHYRLNEEWKLISLKGEMPAGIAGAKSVTVKFDMLRKKIGGFSGCNYYGGKIDIKENKFTCGPLMTTRMACPNSEFESEFQTFLGSGEIEIDLETEKLELTSSNGDVAIFVPNTFY